MVIFFIDAHEGVVRFSHGIEGQLFQLELLLTSPVSAETEGDDAPKGRYLTGPEPQIEVLFVVELWFRGRGRQGGSADSLAMTGSGGSGSFCNGSAGGGGMSGSGGASSRASTVGTGIGSVGTGLLRSQAMTEARTATRPTPPSTSTTSDLPDSAVFGELSVDMCHPSWREVPN